MIGQEQLGARDYVVVIDKSGSMGEPWKKGTTVSRWDHAKESVMALARKCDELDDDGIDVYTFNMSFKAFSGVHADKVAEIFAKESPHGGTDFVPVLTEVFAAAKKSGKPTTVLVITDGQPSEPSGEEALKKLITKTANSLEGGDELGIGFIQIGDDPHARDFLKMLDTGLKDAKFDIVNTKTCDEMENVTIEQVLLDAVND